MFWSLVILLLTTARLSLFRILHTYVHTYIQLLIRTYVCICSNIYICILGLKPTEVYLSRLFIEGYAIKWREIGLELNLTSAELDNIQVDYPRVKERCRTMLNVWLQRDAEASWGKLLIAMQSEDIYRPSPRILAGTVQTLYMYTLHVATYICTYIEKIYNVYSMYDYSNKHAVVKSTRWIICIEIYIMM